MTSIISQHTLTSTADLATVSLFLAKATLLLLAAIVTAAALRRASAGVRHMVWTGALAAIVLLPLLSFWMPVRLAVLPHAIWGAAAPPSVAAGAWPAAGRAPSQSVAAVAVAPGGALSGQHDDAASARPAERAAVSAPAAGESPGGQSRGTESSAAASARSTLLAAPTPPSASGNLDEELLPLSLSLLWAIGTALLLARLLLGMAVVRRVARRARPLRSSEWTVPLWEVADRLGLARAPRLLHSEDVSMPFACGFLHPAVVLPAGAERWDDERRRAVLFHELAHVRRRDLLGHTLGRIACALYWFHPLVWTAARHLRSESERACDDLVLTSGTPASDYAHHLLEIVTGARSAGAPAAALAMARPREFEGRMLAILDPERRRAAPRPLQAAATVAGLAALTLSVSAMAPAAARGEGARAGVQSGTPDSVALPADVMSAPAPAPAAAAAAAPAGRAPQASVPDTGDAASGVAVEERVSSALEVSRRSAAEETAVAIASAARSGFLLDDWSAQLPDVDVEVGDAVGRALGAAMRQPFGASWRRQGGRATADSGSTDLLIDLLASDMDARVRRTAAWALAQREPADPRAVSGALSVALARDSSAEVREMAAWGLGQLGGGSSEARALSDALRGEADERVRTTITWALGSIGDPSASSALDAALADRSSKVRARAAWALGQIEPDAAPQGLLTALRDSSDRVRLAAAWALGQIADTASLTALSDALTTEKDHEIREAELRALILLGDASESTLQKLLDSPDPDVRLKVTRAIVGFRGVRPWPWPMPLPRPIP